MKPIFVRLWASWCVHCKNFAPIWEQLIKLPQYSENLIFASVECDQNRDICKSFDGEGLPRIIWWDTINQLSVRYNGDRVLEHLVSFIDKQFSFPLIKVNSSDIEIYKSKSNAIPFFIFKIGIDNHAHEIAREVSVRMRGYEPVFLIEDGEEDDQHLEAHTGNNMADIYKGEWDVESILNFVHIHTLPFMVDFNGYVLKISENLSMPVLVVINRGSLTEDYTEILKSIKSIVPVASTNCIEGEWFCRFTSNFQGPPSKIFTLINWKRREFWVYDGTIDEDNIIRWINDCKNLKIKGRGPGTGLFRSVKQLYYDFLAGGMKLRFEYILLLPVLIMLVIIIFMVCRFDPQAERAGMKKMMKELKKKRQESEHEKKD